MVRAAIIPLICFLLVAIIPVFSTSTCDPSTQPTGYCDKIIYLSFHGGSGGSVVNNIYAYKMDGTLIGPVLSNGSGLRELRGMAVRNDSSLIVVQAYKDASKLLHYSVCNTGYTRQYVDVFSSTQLSHPYDIAIHGDVVYVTNQDSYLVTSYDLNTGAYIGDVYSLGKDDVRGIAADQTNQYLYIADEKAGRVICYDLVTKEIHKKHSMAVPDVVGVFYDDATGRLYAGSKTTNLVYSFDMQTLAQLHTFSHPQLLHPAGIQVYGNRLLVVGQDSHTILEFDTESAAYLRTVVASMPDDPEQLILVTC